MNEIESSFITFFTLASIGGGRVYENSITDNQNGTVTSGTFD